VPTPELVDCERRAFFVKHSGPKDLQRLEASIRDNSTEAVQVEKLGDIEAGPQNPDAPRYVWVKPTHPWAEDYSVTVRGKGFQSAQRITLRSAKHALQLAMQINIGNNAKPTVSCLDGFARTASDRLPSCKNLTAMADEFMQKLQPLPYNVQKPDGALTIMRMRTLPEPSELDNESEDRHLTEYLQSIMRPTLSQYRGTKLLIFYAGGPRTLRYAREFCDFFRYSLRWQVSGPQLVPVGNERMVDVQVSYNPNGGEQPTVSSLLGVLQGVKHRKRPVLDSDIPPRVIVLWVGPKSPTNAQPDDCSPAVLHPKPGEPHTCQMVSQSPNSCPFVPE